MFQSAISSASNALLMHEEVASAASAAPVLDVAVVGASTHRHCLNRAKPPPRACDVMRTIHAPAAHRSLPKDLWGEVAQYSSHVDLLNLRTITKGMDSWTDRSLTTLTSHADNAAAMLHALRASPNFNHIDTLRIRHCNDTNFPAVITAFAAIPHQKMHLMMSMEDGIAALQDRGPLLDAIHPASMSINFSGSAQRWLLAHAQSQLLGGMTYPLFLGVGLYGDYDEDEQDIQALASISRLRGLDITVDGVSDEAALALKAHRQLLYLRVEDYRDMDLVMSTAAVVTLAGSQTLKHLHIGNTRDVLGKQALQALAANRTLTSLRLGSYEAPFAADAAQVLSANSTLTTLDIALRAGCGHLASIATLEHLTLCSVRTEVTREDAQQFVQLAKLKSLNFSTEVRTAVNGRDGLAGQWRFEPGALAILANTHVEHLSLPAAEWTAEDIEAVLENRTLRYLSCGVVDAAGEGGRKAIIDVARRLAGHPTLEGLSLTFVSPWFTRGASAHDSMTTDERASLFQAWGAHKSVSKLHLQSVNEGELSTQHYRIEPLDQMTHVA